MKKKLTFITGVYNEESVITRIYDSIMHVYKNNLKKKYDYEYIFMDNCSTDNTLKILKGIAKKDKRVKILAYSKNFGPEKSGFIGLINSTGEAVIPYEGSMKDPAELIPKFVKKWEQGFDLVMGVRNKTIENPLLGLFRKLFYRLIYAVSSKELPMNYGSFGLIDKKIVDVLRKVDDYNPYVRGLIASMGFNKTEVPYNRKKRKNKHSKTPFTYLVDFAINALISHSISPIRFCTYLGLFLSTLSFVSAILYLLLKLFYWKVTVPGISGVIILVLFFSGIQLFFLGVIGEYIGAIHSQVRKKPFIVIRERINFK